MTNLLSTPTPRVSPPARVRAGKGKPPGHARTPHPLILVVPRRGASGKERTRNSLVPGSKGMWHPARGRDFLSHLPARVAGAWGIYHGQRLAFLGDMAGLRGKEIAPPKGGFGGFQGAGPSPRGQSP